MGRLLGRLNEKHPSEPSSLLAFQVLSIDFIPERSSNLGSSPSSSSSSVSIRDRPASSWARWGGEISSPSSSSSVRPYNFSSPPSSTSTASHTLTFETPESPTKRQKRYITTNEEVETSLHSSSPVEELLQTEEDDEEEEMEMEDVTVSHSQAQKNREGSIASQATVHSSARLNKRKQLKFYHP